MCYLCLHLHIHVTFQKNRQSSFDSFPAIFEAEDHMSSSDTDRHDEYVRKLLTII